MTSDAVPLPILEELRSVCLGLPEVAEEQAWVGTRWVVRKKTFAHALMLDDAWPEAYARAAEASGPAVVLTFRSSPPELEALRNGGRPFFAPPWRADEVGMLLPLAAREIDWDEIAELLTESFCVQAPKKLGSQVARPEP